MSDDCILDYRLVTSVRVYDEDRDRAERKARERLKNELLADDFDGVIEELNAPIRAAGPNLPTRWSFQLVVEYDRRDDDE